MSSMTLLEMANELQAIIDGERPRLNKTEMREYVRDLRHITQPAQSVDVEMVERACRAFYGERWLRMDQESSRRWMKSALTAALQEKG